MTKVIVLTPVYNDWECLRQLVFSIKKVSQVSGIHIKRIVVVNDNSSMEPDQEITNQDAPIDIVSLNIIVGHQRAIDIGLAYIAKNM